MSRQEPAELLRPPKIHGSVLLNFYVESLLRKSVVSEGRTGLSYRKASILKLFKYLKSELQTCQASHMWSSVPKNDH